MNPSLTKLISNDAVQDQSSSKNVSQTTKKQTKERRILDVVGGVSSFASILEKKGTSLFSEKKGSETKSSVNDKGRLTGGNNEVEKELAASTAIKDGRIFTLKKEEKVACKEPFALEREKLLDNNVKRSGEVISSKVVLDAKLERETVLGKSDKSRFLEGEKTVDKNTTLDLTKILYAQQSDSAHSDSLSELDTTLSLRRGIRGSGSMKKLSLGEAMPIKGEADYDLEPTTASDTNENNPIKKCMPEGMRLTRTGDGSEDHRPMGDLNLSKGFEIKAVMAHKVSSDTKENEILLKDNSIRSEGAQENTISNKVNPVNDKTQEYRNLFADGRQSDKFIERSFNDNLVTKTDAALWTSHADFSGIKGIGNYGSWSNINDDIAAPVQFQNILDQIEDSAAQMMKKGPGRIVITLEPPNLGTLNVDVKVHNDIVRLVLIADNHEVKQVLQSNLDQLKTALQDQGLNMDRFDVLVQQRSSENPGFHQGGGALFEEGRGRRENTKEDNAPPQPLPVHGAEVDEPYLGIISLFA